MRADVVCELRIERGERREAVGHGERDRTQQRVLAAPGGGRGTLAREVQREAGFRDRVLVGRVERECRVERTAGGLDVAAAQRDRAAQAAQHRAVGASGGGRVERGPCGFQLAAFLEQPRERRGVRRIARPERDGGARVLDGRVAASDLREHDRDAIVGGRVARIVGEDAHAGLERARQVGRLGRLRPDGGETVARADHGRRRREQAVGDRARFVRTVRAVVQDRQHAQRLEVLRRERERALAGLHGERVEAGLRRAQREVVPVVRARARRERERVRERLRGFGAVGVVVQHGGEVHPRVRVARVRGDRTLERRARCRDVARGVLDEAEQVQRVGRSRRERERGIRLGAGFRQALRGEVVRRRAQVRDRIRHVSIQPVIA